MSKVNFIFFLLLLGASFALPPGEVCQESTTTAAPTTSECTTAAPPPTSTTGTTPTPPLTCLKNLYRQLPVDCSNAGVNLKMDELTYGTYYHSTDKVHWCDAYQFCVDHNLELAQNLNGTMIDDLDDFYFGVKHAWVGAHNLNGRPGDWRWLDGDFVNDSLWYVATDGHCSTLCPRNQLHSFPCAETIAEGFVCQRPAYCGPPVTTTSPPTTQVPCLGTDLPLDDLGFGSYYKNDNPVSWFEANDFCSLHHLELAHPFNVTTFKALRDFYNVEHYWLGANNLQGDPGDYKWLNGELVDPNLWYEVQNYECATLCYDMHSFRCRTLLGFICQLPQHCHELITEEPPVGTCLIDPYSKKDVDCSLAGANLPMATLTYGTYFRSSAGEATTFCGAYTYCVENNLQLAQNINKSVMWDIENYYYSTSEHHVWIGAHNLEGEAMDYRWLSGDPVDPSLWYSVDPFQCGTLCNFNVLHSFDCDDITGFVCEVPKYCQG